MPYTSSEREHAIADHSVTDEPALDTSGRLNRTIRNGSAVLAALIVFPMIRSRTDSALGYVGLIVLLLLTLSIPSLYRITEVLFSPKYAKTREEFKRRMEAEREGQSQVTAEEPATAAADASAEPTTKRPGVISRLRGRLARSARRRSPQITMIPAEHGQPVDFFYADLSVEDVGLYQVHFEVLLERVDVWNFTSWSMDQEYDRDTLRADQEALGDMLDRLPERVQERALLTMFYQYVGADMIYRERDKEHWVRTVMHPGPRNYFPQAANVWLSLVLATHAESDEA